MSKRKQPEEQDEKKKPNKKFKFSAANILVADYSTVTSFLIFCVYNNIQNITTAAMLIYLIHQKYPQIFTLCSYLKTSLERECKHKEDSKPLKITLDAILLDNNLSENQKFQIFSGLESQAVLPRLASLESLDYLRETVDLFIKFKKDKFVKNQAHTGLQQLMKTYNPIICKDWLEKVNIGFALLDEKLANQPYDISIVKTNKKMFILSFLMTQATNDCELGITTSLQTLNSTAIAKCIKKALYFSSLQVKVDALNSIGQHGTPDPGKINLIRNWVELLITDLSEHNHTDDLLKCLQYPSIHPSLGGKNFATALVRMVMFNYNDFLLEKLLSFPYWTSLQWQDIVEISTPELVRQGGSLLQNSEKVTKLSLSTFFLENNPTAFTFYLNSFLTSFKKRKKSREDLHLHYENFLGLFQQEESKKLTKTFLTALIEHFPLSKDLFRSIRKIYKIIHLPLCEHYLSGLLPNSVGHIVFQYHCLGNLSQELKIEKKTNPLSPSVSDNTHSTFSHPPRTTSSASQSRNPSRESGRRR